MWNVMAIRHVGFYFAEVSVLPPTRGLSALAELIV